MLSLQIIIWSSISGRVTEQQSTNSTITYVIVIDCVVSDKSLWSTAVYNIFVYRICQSFSVSQHSLWNRCIQSETSTNSSVSGRMFLRFNVTLPLYVHKWTIQLFVSIVRWRFLLGGDRNGRPCRHNTASGTDSGLTHGAGELAHVGTSRRRCLPPPHSACRLSTTSVCEWM